MTVTVKMLVDRLKLKVVYGNKELLAKTITTADISRPGLEMTGYFDYYSPERLQLVGMKEWSYLKTMTENNRYSVFTNMFKAETPAVIVARGLDIPEEMLRAAKENGVAVLQGRNGTSSLSGDMSWYLNSQLAERTSVHGVLVDIYGMGVLIHRVDVYAKDEETLWGEPAEILRHLLEIRGVGIIDVMSLYGASAVRNSSQVQLAIYLENFEDGKIFDRLGNGNEEIELQGVKIPRVRIPVKTGRNVSVVIEAAAMNYRAKQMGFDATKTFEERLTNLISKNGED